MRVNNPFLPINVEEWDKVSTGVYLYTGEMNRDFGPWLKGTKLTLQFDFDDGIVVECGEKVVKYQFELNLSLGAEIKE